MALGLPLVLDMRHVNLHFVLLSRSPDVKPIALCTHACTTLHGCELALINDKGVDGAQHAKRVLIEMHAHDVALAYG